MNNAHIINNDQPSIIYEAASTADMMDDSSHGEEFFNQIMFRSFMVLSVSAIAANLRVIAERLI